MGPGTARALKEHGIEADVVPERSVAEGMVEALADVDARRVLIARGKEGRDVLPDALRERGAQVDVLALYETVRGAARRRRDPARLARRLRHLHLRLDRPPPARGGRGDALDGPRLASIGPATSAELRAHGREPDLEADPHTPDGLVDAVLADARR